MSRRRPPSPVWRVMARPAAAMCRAGIALLLAFAIAACDKPAPAPVTLRIGVYQTANLLPYYVMRVQGLDKKHGLTFEETVFPGGAGAIEAMVAGVLDLSTGIATMPLLAAAERGLVPDRLTPVAVNSFADPEHPAVGILAAPGIRGWKDLEGRKIGINARTSIAAGAVDARLRLEGVLGYSFVEIPFSNLGLAVAGGNVAAASMNEPHLTQSLLRGDGKLLDWVVGGPPLEHTAFRSIVFSTEFRERNPEGVKAFLRAHIAAVRWSNPHPAEARLVLAKRLNLSAEVGRKIDLLHVSDDARADPGLFEQTQQVLLRSGLLKRAVDMRALYDETLLLEVLKENR